MTNLTPEIEKQISDRADELTLKMPIDNDYQVGYVQGFMAGHEVGAAEWAGKLHQVKQDNAQLKQWKAEASELVNPILRYGQSKEAGIPLGESITDTVIERCKKFDQARAILEKVKSRREAGLLPDRFIYDEIKQFLDGTK